MSHNPLRKRRWFSVLGVVVLSAGMLAGLACVRKPQKLRWKMEQGKTYVYRNDFTGTWKIEGWDQGERGGEFGKLLMSEISVLETSDSIFKLREESRIVKEDREFKSTIVEYRMYANGKMYGIEVFDPDSATQVFPSKQRREQFFEQSQPTYPDKDLAPGDNWVQETKVVLDDKTLTTTNDFSVETWEKVDGYNCLKIHYSGKMVIPHEKNGKELLDNATAKGAIWFAPEEGLLIQQIDSLYVATQRVMPEGEKPPSTYVVESVRIYQLVEIK